MNTDLFLIAKTDFEAKSNQREVVSHTRASSSILVPFFLETHGCNFGPALLGFDIEIGLL